MVLLRVSLVLLGLLLGTVSLDHGLFVHPKVGWGLLATTGQLPADGPRHDPPGPRPRRASTAEPPPSPSPPVTEHWTTAQRER